MSGNSSKTNFGNDGLKRPNTACIVRGDVDLLDLNVVFENVLVEQGGEPATKNWCVMSSC